MFARLIMGALNHRTGDLDIHTLLNGALELALWNLDKVKFGATLANHYSS